MKLRKPDDLRFGTLRGNNVTSRLLVQMYLYARTPFSYTAAAAAAEIFIAPLRKVRLNPRLLSSPGFRYSSKT